MHIIPVIDLLDGQVVHARCGERHRYQPIQSTLCKGSEPLDILLAMLELYPFEQLYIADINSIQKRGDHAALINEFILLYPQVNILLDAGFSDIEVLKNYGSSKFTSVLGSESLPSIQAYQALRNFCGNRSVLSLDFTSDGFHGPQELLENPDYWLETVITMTLARVGSNAGVDTETLTDIVARASGKRFMPPAVSAIRMI